MDRPVVRVLPDVAAIGKAFDYVVPDELATRVGIGTIVRVALHGRRVRGWVIADDVESPPGVNPVPISKVTGHGPAPELIDLARWAAWRWAGPVTALLRTASPLRAVSGLPPPPPVSPPAAAAVTSELAAEAVSHPRAVALLPPAADAFPVVEQTAARGATLVLAPSAAMASTLARRLSRSGRPVALVPDGWARAAAGGSVVIGSRAAAWAPCPGLRTVVVIDAHDEVFQEERAPTWNAWQVAAERARRAGAGCVLVSSCPSLEQRRWGHLVRPSRSEERQGWAPLDVIDRRGDDPRTGLFSARLVAALRAGGRAVCVLNRKGRARLLACAACGELARCEQCGGRVEEREQGLACSGCGAIRPRVCAACGSQRLRVLRVGVTRVREELEALLGVPVGEVTGDDDEVPDADVLVGTEAVLHRLSDSDVVAFLDFDQELLAPRYRAGEQSLALLARAARLVGGRRPGARVIVQTRVPDHEVLDAALHADADRWAKVEEPRREALGLPPFAALAAVSGRGAADLVAQLGALEVAATGEERWLVRAPDHRTLCDALAGAARPPGRLRVEVDPLRA